MAGAIETQSTPPLAAGGLHEPFLSAEECGAEIEYGELESHDHPGTPPTLTFTDRQLVAFVACVVNRPAEFADGVHAWNVSEAQDRAAFEADLADLSANHHPVHLHRPTTPPSALTFDMFRRANVARCIKWHPAGIGSWSPSDWLVAAMGELGELASEVKTFNRARDGLTGNKEHLTSEERQLRMANEAADVVTYLDLFCAERGIDLGAAVVRKFNEVSERVGFPDRIVPCFKSATAPAADAISWGLSDDQLAVLLSESLKPEEIGGDAKVQVQRVRELLHWFARFARGHANPKWAVSHAYELAYYIATNAGNRYIDTNAIAQDGFVQGLNVTPAERDMLVRIGVAKATLPGECASPVRAVDERSEAEQAYTMTAFDYARDPVGSDRWCQFWTGWQARAALAQSTTAASGSSAGGSRHD